MLRPEPPRPRSGGRQCPARIERRGRRRKRTWRDSVSRLGTAHARVLAGSDRHGENIDGPCPAAGAAHHVPARAAPPGARRHRRLGELVGSAGTCPRACAARVDSQRAGGARAARRRGGRCRALPDRAPARRRPAHAARPHRAVQRPVVRRRLRRRPDRDRRRPAGAARGRLRGAGGRLDAVAARHGGAPLARRDNSVEPVACERPPSLRPRQRLLPALARSGDGLHLCLLPDTGRLARGGAGREDGARGAQAAPRAPARP